MTVYIESRIKDKPNDWVPVCCFVNKELANIAMNNLKDICETREFRTEPYKVGGFAIK